jgi:uncharacterized membrane protein YcaP (DUF421 family)
MSDLMEIALRVPLVVGAIILLTRIHGLRSFSKMSGFDFAITVSVGSLLAGDISTPGTALPIFLVALGVLYAVQIVLSQTRARLSPVREALDNAPILVMENGMPIDENLKTAGMTLADLYAKLREANAYDFTRVHAVIMESTGDVSVLHGDPAGPKPDDRLLQGVRR